MVETLLVIINALFQIFYQAVQATAEKLQRVHKPQTIYLEGNVFLHVVGYHLNIFRSIKPAQMFDDQVCIVATEIMENHRDEIVCSHMLTFCALSISQQQVAFIANCRYKIARDVAMMADLVLFGHSGQIVASL